MFIPDRSRLRASIEAIVVRVSACGTEVASSVWYPSRITPPSLKFARARAIARSIRCEFDAAITYFRAGPGAVKGASDNECRISGT